MKKLVFLLFLMFCSFAHAETYYVNTEVLNLRSCEGTHCEILGKLTSGEVVEVIKDNGEWVKVQTEKGVGVFILALVLWIVWFFYFLPSRIAAGNKNANKVYRVNLLLGWIPIIWLLLLFAALIGENRED